MISFNQFVLQLNEADVPPPPPGGDIPPPPGGGGMPPPPMGGGGGMGGGMPPPPMGGGGGDMQPVESIDVSVKDVWKALGKAADDMENHPELNVSYFEKNRKEDFEKAIKNSLIN